MSETMQRVATLRAEMDSLNIPKDKQALILGQFKKESGNFQYLKELGNKDYFNKYDIKTNPEKAKELGNTEPGDGYKYRGRAFVQLTGKANYAKYSQEVFGDNRLVTNPELLENPSIASKVSLAYVNDRAGDFQTADDLTRAINPGLFSKNLSKEKQAKYAADIQARRDNAEIFNKQFTLANQDNSFVVDGDWGKNSKKAWEEFQTKDQTVPAQQESVEQQSASVAPPPANIDPSDTQAIKSIQAMSGLTGSAVDGVWGPQSAKAYAEIVRKDAADLDPRRTDVNTPRSQEFAAYNQQQTAQPSNWYDPFVNPLLGLFK